MSPYYDFIRDSLESAARLRFGGEFRVFIDEGASDDGEAYYEMSFIAYKNGPCVIFCTGSDGMWGAYNSNFETILEGYSSLPELARSPDMGSVINYLLGYPIL